MTEADFQAVVTGLAKVFGWRWMHARRSIGKNGWTTATNVPWPDLTLWHPSGGFMIRELKVRNKWQPSQREVLDELAVSVDAAVWTPADLDSGLIARELSHKRGVRG